MPRSQNSSRWNHFYLTRFSETPRIDWTYLRRRQFLDVRECDTQSGSVFTTYLCLDLKSQALKLNGPASCARMAFGSPAAIRAIHRAMSPQCA